MEIDAQEAAELAIIDLLYARAEITTMADPRALLRMIDHLDRALAVLAPHASNFDMRDLQELSRFKIAGQWRSETIELARYFLARLRAGGTVAPPVAQTELAEDSLKLGPPALRAFSQMTLGRHPRIPVAGLASTRAARTLGSFSCAAWKR
ncbi:hypothetical protein CCR94_10465 [Rhodoblastus sphagnicola]|uniref:Uncharacterized protein n=1 Tax=Rhodoblastus sphagnicola TaxID=333368 RepID=A0A2S6N8W0_9HYPH|nr:hypothetical protein [Rhodoblastus sphagnicola]MBB4201087.1 hypothetical protein [Rhodoblastus sphagnicola]PPQ31048.1 hypothetical protein CCR94_10465 [Rhodoblastus sphagnicola]